MHSPWGTAEVHLGVRGSHNVANALAASAAALVIGVPLEAVAAGLGQVELSPWRMDLQTSPSGALVLNDAYNAGPASMAAALRSLAALDAARPSRSSGSWPSSAGTAPAPTGRWPISPRTWACGSSPSPPPTTARRPTTCPTSTRPGPSSCADGPLGSGDAVLVKGSRVAGLERLAALICSTAA